MISQGPSVCIFNKNDSQEVLASWLFTEYLLTNDVQIAYSKTEGYVPVTSKAQQSEEYIDYLSHSGEDTNEHYEVKLKATEMMLEHIDDTFVTPVYNGSASLRNAAGQLIENVTKSVRRHETVDDAYMDTLFDDVTSLYRLDQSMASGGSGTSGKAELGRLPDISIGFLSILAAAWVLIGAYYLSQWLKKRRKH